MMFSQIKDLVLIKPFTKIRYNILFRESLLVFFFVGIPFVLSLFWSRQIFLSLAFFFFCLIITLLLCNLPICQKGWVRNCFFIGIFMWGCFCYIKLDELDKCPNTSYSFLRNSNTTLSAFFPSRGTYEEFYTDSEINAINQDKTKVAWSYFCFHSATYIFVGYLIMSIWGYKSINRLWFFLTRDSEKNVFWCVTPEANMLKLAKDILENSDESSQPVFSVDEVEYVDQKLIFQDMNYQKFCLKLRKPNQIHKYCLSAARHFFLSENTDWNIDMAQALLNARSTIKTPTKIYIRINNDARKIYYTRWAEQYNKSVVEIIFIDDCALIIDKFIQQHHILQSFTECIDPNTLTVNKDNGFRYLVIGFGGLGQEVLKHLICDTQFLDSNNELVPLQIDIVENNIEKITLFQKQYSELLERFDKIHFIMHEDNKTPISVGTMEFYSFFEDNYTKYDRIVVALGETMLSIETIAQMEDIIRKQTDLFTGDPSVELKKWKEKIFLISPNISGYVFQNKDNVFSVFGADNEIYNYSDIVNEKIFYLAKLINYRYNTGTVISFDNLRGRKDDLNKEWRNADFYCRQSSYATALGLDNVRLLVENYSNRELYVGENSMFLPEKYTSWINSVEASALRDTLGKMEHSRWWAFMLCCGYVSWKKPIKREGVTEKANMTVKYGRHATMIEWEKMPQMDIIFPDVETFKDKDLRIIEALPYFYNIMEESKNRI